VAATVTVAAAVAVVATGDGEHAAMAAAAAAGDGAHAVMAAATPLQRLCSRRDIPGHG